jgi:acetyl-CoA carboxylase biotin carboxyl carrier protein
MMGNFIEFDAAAIRELAQILRETDLTEIELVNADQRLRVVRQAVIAAPPATQVTVAAPAPMTVAAAPPPAEPLDADHPGAVTSPMVGVAYLSPEPGAASFVTVGAKVAQGQTLLLIEAMKTYNQIKATRAGTVEYGEPLMIIE